MKTYIDGLKAARGIVERATKEYYATSGSRGFEAALLNSAIEAINDIEADIDCAIMEAEKDD